MGGSDSRLACRRADVLPSRILISARVVLRTAVRQKACPRFKLARQPSAVIRASLTPPCPRQRADHAVLDNPTRAQRSRGMGTSPRTLYVLRKWFTITPFRRVAAAGIHATPAPRRSRRRYAADAGAATRAAVLVGAARVAEVRWGGGEWKQRSASHNQSARARCGLVTHILAALHGT